MSHQPVRLPSCNECGEARTEYAVCRSCWMAMHGSQLPLPTDAELIDFGKQCVRGYLDFDAARKWFLAKEVAGGSGVAARIDELASVLDRFSDAVAELLVVLPQEIAPENVAAVRREFGAVNRALRAVSAGGEEKPRG